MSLCKIIRGASADLVRENQKLAAQLNEERQRRDELETAVIELGELFAEQDDALVELAEIIMEG